MKLSQKFEEALVYASVVHGGQIRKATGIPYIAHLLGVASIAFEYGADENEAIGALLHDAAEDAGGAARIDDIRVRFGEKVATIVECCTDTLETPKPPWRERKEKYLTHLKETDSSTRLVSAADKLFNTRSILRELRQRGDAVWARFSGGKKDRLWYYRALVTAFRQYGDHSDLIDELDRVVTEIEKLVREEGESPAVKR
jgi:(p)ppGpp synthase/HD superfamily hydrolase